MFRHVMSFEYYIGQQADFAKPSQSMNRFSVLATIRSSMTDYASEEHGVASV
jgi:hypothetical protein